jgi:predicted Zn-dependent protease
MGHLARRTDQFRLALFASELFMTSTFYRLRGLVLAVCLGLGNSLPSQAQLPSMGEAGGMTLSAERQLGDQIARELFRDPDYIDDPVLLEYVQDIWTSLMAAARARGDLAPEQDDRLAMKVILGRDREVNAFALPGGYMGVYLGLISIVESRDELASVLGHELSHITQRHISRQIANEGQQTPLLVAAMILGVLAASKSPNAASALIVGGQAATMQNQLKFSRDMEREADRVGYGVMTQAGFDGAGFVTMFDKLQLASRLNDNGAYPYLRSHPLTTERIADMQAREQLKPAKPPRAKGEEVELAHAMIMARARGLGTPGVDLQRQWLVDVDTMTFGSQPVWRQVQGLYVASLVASQQRHFGVARRLVRRLEALVRADPKAMRYQTLLAAEVELAAGNATPASSLIFASQGPRPELMLAAQARLQGASRDQADSVAQLLQTWVTLHVQDGPAWFLLSQAWGRAGKPLRSLHAEAESRVATLDYAAAMDRFKAAQEMVRREGEVAQDHMEASIVDTRTREVALLLKEQASQR